MRFPRLGLLLVLALFIAALGAACGSGNNGNSFALSPDGSIGDDGSSSGGGDGQSLFGDGASGEASGPIAISPQNKVITVPYGTHAPTVQYTATAGGSPVPASFAIDLGQVGRSTPRRGCSSRAASSAASRTCRRLTAARRSRRR